MNQKELKELIEFLIEKDIAEFELERGDVKVRIKRAAEGVPSPTGVPAPQFAVHPTHAAPAPAVETGPAGAIELEASSEAAPAVAANLQVVRSPIVGTYYEAPSPGAPPFVKVGDVVGVGQVLCIVEAMKLMNEIESDSTGKVVKICVENGKPVEYNQVLFLLEAA